MSTTCAAILVAALGPKADVFTVEESQMRMPDTRRVETDVVRPLLSIVGPAGPGSRIDFVRYQIPPSTVLGPAAAHAPGTVEHMHVVAGTVRVTVGDETAELAAGDSCSCRTDAPHAIENPDPSAEALIYLIVERG